MEAIKQVAERIAEVDATSGQNVQIQPADCVDIKLNYSQEDDDGLGARSSKKKRKIVSDHAFGNGLFNSLFIFYCFFSFLLYVYIIVFLFFYYSIFIHLFSFQDL